MSTLYLIRHAQASFAAEDYDQLSDLGRQQARILGSDLVRRGLQADAVFCGALRRHRQTADCCLHAMSRILPINTLDHFNEYDHQEIIARHTPRYADQQVLMEELAREKDPRRSFQKFYSAAVSRWAEGQHDDDYQEPWHQFRQRCLAGLEEIRNSLHPQAVALVFTSGGPITAICEFLLELPIQRALDINWSLVNTGITKLISGRQHIRISSINEHAHLEAASTGMLTYR